MKYAVVAVGGKQYQVKEGGILVVDRQVGEPNSEFNLDQVLLAVNEDKRQVGTPAVEKAMVKAKVLEHFLGDKLRVATYKAKSRYRRVKGHRSKLTKLLIEKIVFN